MAAAEEKTEAATPKKRADLRRRGQVAKSHDLAAMAAFIAAIVALHSLVGVAGGRIGAFLKVSMEAAARDPLETDTLVRTATAAVYTLAHILGPFFLTAMLVGVIANVAQTGPMFSPQALKPDFTRLNPLAGIARLVSSRGAVETAKAMLKLLIVGGIAYRTVSAVYPDLVGLSELDIGSALALVGDVIYRLALRIALLLLVLSAIDYAYQRYAFEKANRMAKHEVRREMKENEVSPQLRSRIRQKARELARRRMMQDVPEATVVVTNPTHYAIALKYESSSMQAPIVVAKGADLVAARIRDIAGEHRIPIVENPPLARGLYRRVDIGKEIPAEFYTAVAEVLGYVYSINRGHAPSAR